MPVTKAAVTNIRQQRARAAEGADRDGYAPRERKVFWSWVFLAAGFILIGGGGAMLALSLTVESDVDALTDHYNVPTTLLAGGLLGLGAGCALLAIVKGCWLGHL